MLRIYADKFVFVMNALAALQRELDKHPLTTVSLFHTDQIVPGLQQLVEIFTELEMPISKRDAKALLQMCERHRKSPAATYKPTFPR
jgi:hypothetical protein